MSQGHVSRTVSVKVQGNAAEEIFAIVKLLERKLPGCRVTTGIRPSDHTKGKGRFDFEYYLFLLVPFELDPDGNARPTERNAVLAFQEGRPGPN